MKTIFLILIFAVLLVLAVKEPDQTFSDTTRAIVSEARTAGSVVVSAIEDRAVIPPAERSRSTATGDETEAIAPAPEAVPEPTAETEVPGAWRSEPGGRFSTRRIEPMEPTDVPEMEPTAADRPVAADEGSEDFADPLRSVEALYREASELLAEIK